MIHGDVSTQRGDAGTYSAAVLNQPVVNGDKVSTAAGGARRGAAGLREHSSPGIELTGEHCKPHASNIFRFRLRQGLANYSVFGESEAEPEIDTPNVAVHPAHTDGVFRIEVRPDGDSIIIVRKGQAQISTPQGIADLKQGDMVTVRGAGADARYKIAVRLRSGTIGTDGTAIATA
jgi:mannose-6-phosphate isomerase-like protein (cupin superfamily)